MNPPSRFAPPPTPVGTAWPGPPASPIALNPEQREAVEHYEGPILVLAGAGSGKTRVLTTRVFRLITEHGVPPSRILAVTFTNKAAGEMRDRIAGMLGGQPTGIWMGTFHALGARLLRRHAPRLGWTRSFSIFDAEQSLRQLKRAVVKVGLDPKRWSPKALRAQVSDAKNQLVGAEAFARNHGSSAELFLRNAARVYPVYQQALRNQDAVDFDDLLVLPVRLFEQDEGLLRRYQERFSFILVDEYQDTNRGQFRFLELLAAKHQNLMVVGDDDQSIYGWRGADIRNILDFEKSFPGAAVVRLEQNYRSTPVILAAAHAVIRQNEGRREKTLRTDRVGGAPVTCLEAVDEIDEARWIVEEIERRIRSDPGIGHRDFAVLYRTNAQARALEDGFRRRGVPYQVVGGVRFYERREIQDVLAYLRLVSNPRDRDAFERVVNYPRRGVGRVTLERLSGFAAEAGVGLLEAAERANEIPRLTPAAVRGLKRFAGIVRRCSALAAHGSVGEVLEALINETDLLLVLRNEGPDGEDRVENVAELTAGARNFEAEGGMDGEEEDRNALTELDLFLQQVALVADVDRHDPGADVVTLMTLHNAKGLEFPVVFISGLEEGLFPLARSYDELRLLEEERRLFYVGVTRARKKLYLTHARQRFRAGERSYSGLSSFVECLEDLERRVTERIGTLPKMWRRGNRGRGSPKRPVERDFGDDGFDQDRPRYTKGERVVHETFGPGTIVELSGFGRDLKVTVDFVDFGRRKLMVRYAALERDYGEFSVPDDTDESS